MPDFYFRGSLSQFWQFTYAEYDRLSSIFGKECFEFFEPNPKEVSLTGYEPRYSDQVHFIIWEAGHRDFPVRVRASTALGSELVEMYVSVYVDVLKTLGDSCLDVWNAYAKSLEEQGLLFKPTDFLASLPSKPLKPKKGSDRILFHLYFERMKEAGYKYTFKQLGADMGLSESYAKHLHGNFLKAGAAK